MSVLDFLHVTGLAADIVFCDIGDLWAVRDFIDMLKFGMIRFFDS